MKGEKEFFRKRFFGGFNRNDVIKYIAKIAEERNVAIAAKDKAEKEVRELTAEVEKLRKETKAPEEVKMQVNIIDFSEHMETTAVREVESTKEIAEIDDDIAAIKEIGQIKDESQAENTTTIEEQEAPPEPTPDEPVPSEPVRYAAPSESVWRAVPVTQIPDEEPPPEPFLYAGSPDQYWFSDPSEQTPPESPQEEPPTEEPIPEEPSAAEPIPEEPPIAEPIPEEPPAPEPPPAPPPVEEEKAKTARVKIKIRKIQ